METSYFYQVTDDNEHSENDDNDDDDDNGVIIDSVEQESESARAKLERVLSAVASGQHKNSLSSWVNAVLYKLSLVAAKNATDRHQRLPTLNQRLGNENLSAFHRTTLAGISSEVSKSLEEDFRHGHV